MKRRNSYAISLFIFATAIPLCACSTSSPDARAAQGSPGDETESFRPSSDEPFTGVPDLAHPSNSGTDTFDVGDGESAAAVDFGEDSPASALSTSDTGVGTKAMLLLGHWSEEGRQVRAKLACQVIQEKSVTFDTIVVSGGCKPGRCGPDDDHDGKPDGCFVRQPTKDDPTPPCGPLEADDMKAKLEATCGISPTTIKTESESANTVANLCNSEKILNTLKPIDLLYVVSSHHHAFSVAACLKKRLSNNNVFYYYPCDDYLTPIDELRQQCAYNKSKGTCCNGSELGGCCTSAKYEHICTDRAPDSVLTQNAEDPCRQDYTRIAARCNGLCQ